MLSSGSSFDISVRGPKHSSRPVRLDGAVRSGFRPFDFAQDRLCGLRFGYAYAQARKTAQIVKDRCGPSQRMGPVALGRLVAFHIKESASRDQNGMGGRGWEADSVKSTAL